MADLIVTLVATYPMRVVLQPPKREVAEVGKKPQAQWQNIGGVYDHRRKNRVRQGKKDGV